MQFVLSDENKFSTVSKRAALVKVHWQYGLARDCGNAGLFVSISRRQKTGTTRDVQATVKDASCLSRIVAVFEHDKRMHVLDLEDHNCATGFHAVSLQVLLNKLICTYRRVVCAKPITITAGSLMDSNDDTL